MPRTGRRCRKGEVQRRLPQLRRRGAQQRQGVLPPQSSLSDLRFRAAEEAASICRANSGEMSIWQAMEFLNTLVDDSDPDVDFSQIEHLMQAAEAIRADGHPRWFILTGLLHDLGKVLCLYGEPQWAVVGDTFPVGCAYSERSSTRSSSRTIPTVRIPPIRPERHL